MVPRYEVEAISRIWSEPARWQRVLEVELHLLAELEASGMAPAGTRVAFDAVRIDVPRIHELETLTRHDLLAFCASITEQVPTEAGRFFHYGVTSSDVLDTALALQLRDSLHIVERSLSSVLTSLDEKIEETRDLLCVGRSHGMSAEPMIFAHKFLSSRAEFTRRLRDVRHLIDSELTGQMSGAVGNHTFLDPSFESRVLARMGLPVEPVSTQVIPRDRVALVLSIGALIATAIERISIEIRHLHHSDVAEVHEGFRPGQKGSSVMPHKRNPVSTENLCGLARVIRSHVDIGHQDSLLWHERDISHSSAERIVLPDHFGLLVYSLDRLHSTLGSLGIHRDHIEGKVRQQFSCLSSRALHELVEKNVRPREALYAVVQESAFTATDLDDFTRRLQDRCDRDGLQFDPSILSWDGVKQAYRKNFDAVWMRFKEGL
jgi:adenylosuccinate lyase